MSFSRRDFLQLVGAGSVAGAAGGVGCAPDDRPLDRPLYCEGRIRGEDHGPGHALRDGRGPWPRPPVPVDAPLRDVIVVGAGISGLAAAWALHHAGVDDLLIHVAVRDADHLRELAMDALTTRPEVERMQTALIFEHARSPVLPQYLGAPE